MFDLAFKQSLATRVNEKLREHGRLGNAPLPDRLSRLRGTTDNGDERAGQK
jgi:hypothetical protein